jgi:hypothetical protein
LQERICNDVRVQFASTHQVIVRPAKALDDKGTFQTAEYETKANLAGILTMTVTSVPSWIPTIDFDSAKKLVVIHLQDTPLQQVEGKMWLHKSRAEAMVDTNQFNQFMIRQVQ